MIVWALIVIALASCVSKPDRRALAEEYYNLGNEHLKTGSFDRAVELFARAIETDPDLLQAYHNLSLALARAGRGDEAIANLTTVLESDPDNTSLLTILAFAHHRQGALEESLKTYRAVVDLNPGARDALYNIGLIQWEMGQFDEAAESFEEILQLDVEDAEFSDSLYNLGVLSLEREDSKAASGYLARYLEWSPQDTDAYELLASAYKASEQYLDALETYDALLQASDEAVEAWFGKAEILLTHVEDPVAGLRALREALKLGFDDIDRLQALLGDPLVLERERVEATIREWNLLPEI